MATIHDQLVSTARKFVHAHLSFDWTANERIVLERAFTNIDKRVFFVYNVLPANMISVLMAMYSRLKNPRGIRGIFVDAFLPQVMTMFVDEFVKDSQLSEDESEFSHNPIKYLKKYDIESLDQFIEHKTETKEIFEKFLKSWTIDIDYFAGISQAERMKSFLSTWLDKYGHNSIARPSMFYLCVEQISILAAKSLEWTRPGAGYIELSTRYVDMSGRDSYPIENELELFGISADDIRFNTKMSFDFIKELQGDNLDGEFAKFVWDYYAGHVPEDKLKVGVSGEVYDVVNNLLPCQTLSSVGIGISGESLPQLLKHLHLDSTAENYAIAELIIDEAPKVGANQFIRHLGMSAWQTASWEYETPLTDGFKAWLPDRDYAEKILFDLLRKKPQFSEATNLAEIFEEMLTLERTPFDKLYNEFESVSAYFSNAMSFRGHRDLQRMGFSTHLRSRVTPEIGFYKYDKPAPEILHQRFNDVHVQNKKLYAKMLEAKVPDSLRQYPMAIGNLVSYTIGSNLLQWEFCNWQRSKPSVNHEVRQHFLQVETALRNTYPWWADISRADICPAYVFARGDSDIPLASIK